VRRGNGLSWISLNVEVAVVGGGVIGSSIAYHLARRGVTVALIEKDDIASAASGASAGGVRQQGRDLREMPLAIQSIARWSHLSDELDADLEYVRGGHVRLLEDQVNLDTIQPWIDEQVALGLDLRLVTGRDLQELIPGLASHVLAGTYSPDDGHANPTLTTVAFAQAAERLGATIQTGSRVTTVHHEADRITGITTDAGKVACQTLVIAAGAWSTRLMKRLGIDLPVSVMAPQMILTKPMPPLLRQVIGSAERWLSLKQIATGGYLIGGGWPGDADLDASVATPRPSSIEGSYAAASTVFPVLNQVEIERVWVGIEAVTPDEIPILGPVPGFANLTIATGFSGHGFALSPIVGQLIAESIVDGTPSLDLSAFALDRGRSANTPKLDAG
jgi:sarcosine oxidase, subunit beta